MIGFLCYTDIVGPFVKVLLLEKRWKEVNSFLTLRVKINKLNSVTMKRKVLLSNANAHDFHG